MRPPVSRMNMFPSPQPYEYQWRPCGRGNGINMHINPPFAPSINLDNEQYWCETCDRGFPAANVLDRHKQQHQKCNIDGCQFVAHPKVITKHIQMQHSSGLYKKIAKLDNPEDIQRWREERKKKYPTRINIEKKAAEVKEKIERGEKMALNQNSRSKPWNKDQRRDRKRKYGFDKNQTHRTTFYQRQNCDYKDTDQPPAKKITKSIPKLPSVITKNKLKPFAGILNIVMKDNEPDVLALDNNNTLIEDDCYEDVATCAVMKPQEPALCGALTSLMCDYGSSEDEINIRENDILIDAKVKIVETIKDSVKNYKETVNVKRNINTVYQNQLEKNIRQTIQSNQIDNKENSDDNSGPEEVKTQKENLIAVNMHEESKNTNKNTLQSTKLPVRPRNDHKQNNVNKHKVPSTLLQKLLHKEIIQERNIILQCIRYIKMKNYFSKTVE